MWAANSLVTRARQLGSVEPYHFLFPYKRGNSPYLPTWHMADNGLRRTQQPNASPMRVVLRGSLHRDRRF
jgi:hypothetical protein